MPSPASAIETGVNSQDLSPRETVERVDQLGVQWVRRFVRWDEIEPSQGVWNPAPLDYVSELHALKPSLKIMLVVTGAPSWANGSSDPLVPPQNPQDYAYFMGRAASALKGKVDTWEIWNEADEVHFWHGSPPSPEAYSALLKPAYTAVKSADPQAKVYAGPLTGNNFPFLEKLYQNGAKGYFDGVSVHTDTACNVNSPETYYRTSDGLISQYTFLGFIEVHRVMEENGDGDKPIAMSEIGWSVAPGLCQQGKWAGMKPAGVSESNQAAYLVQGFRCMARYPYMRMGAWFSLRDASAVESELSRYGLATADMAFRPSWFAMQQLNASPVTPLESCGDFDGPSLKVLSPTAGEAYNHGLYLSASAADNASPVKRIRFSYKDKPIGSFSSPTGIVERTWIGARDLPYGPVEITVEAKDTIGNASRQVIEVNHVNPRNLPSQKVSLSLSLKGTGRYRTLSGEGAVKGTQLTPTGKVLVKFQQKRGSSWVTRFERRKNIPYGFELKRKFSKGTWRARVVYPGQRPFAASSAQSSVFRVK